MKIFNLNADVDWDRTEEREGWRFKDAWVGAHTGAELIGASTYEVEPGNKQGPFHTHHANEEWAIVLRGEPTLRTHEGEQQLRQGDVVAFPRGKEGAHQIRNDTDAPVRVLMLSTLIAPDIVEYLDTGKIGARSVAGERIIFARPVPSSSIGRTRTRPHQADCAVPFTLRNINRRIWRTSARTFDGAPDLDVPCARRKALDLERSALSYQRVPPELSLSVRPHATRSKRRCTSVLRGSGADEGRRRDRGAQGVGRGARPSPYVARTTRPGQRASRSSSSARPISARIRAKTSMASATGGLTSSAARKLS